MAMEGRWMLHFFTLILVLVRLTSCSVGFGNMETFVSLPLLEQQSFYVLQEDIFRPGTIVAALENAVVSIDPHGAITVISGTPDEGGYEEGATPLFNTIQGIFQLNRTMLIVSDHSNDCLRYVNKQTGRATTYTGQCGSSSHADGSLEEAGFSKPADIEKFGYTGKIVVVEFSEGRLRTVDLEDGEVRTIFDTRVPLTHFLYALPNEYYIIAKTAIFIVENLSASLYSGNGAGFIDANRTESRYGDLQGVVSLSSDLLVVADRSNDRLRVVPREGNVQSLCIGEYGHTNGDIESCRLLQPYSLLVMNGKLYIGESGYLGGGIRTLPILPGQFTISGASIL